MIVKEIITINGKQFRHTYSNINHYIQKIRTNERYEEAIDLLSSNYIYIETKDKIYSDEEESNNDESSYSEIDE